MRTKSKDLMNKMIDFIDKTYETTGITPSYREIAREFNITSACVSNYINEMNDKNMLSIQEHTRGITTNKMQLLRTELYNVPVVGSIACGSPILAEENIERYISIPKTLVGNGKFFILVAHGNSMINANISDGDLVIIKQQDTAEIGQIIVALIDNEATLKRYYIDKKNKKIRLHPENDNMEDMYFDKIQIQGVAVKVIKDLI
ncbi:MAG: transcriptional repressor LexA [Christensenellales bacterium]